MAANLDRRIGALEVGNGTIGVGDVLDAIDVAGLNLSDPQTWPATWRGKAIDPRMLASLDALNPGFDRMTTDEVEARVHGASQSELTIDGA
jgi:hypothetical protein